MYGIAEIWTWALETELSLSPNLANQDNLSENNFPYKKDKLISLSEKQSVKYQL